jgi:NADH-quinone oxidoreductase subunit G
MLGAGPDTLAAITDGSHEFSDVLSNAKNPMIVIGEGALARPDGAAILAAARRVAERYAMVRDGENAWNGFNVLHRAAARVGGLDLGFVPGTGGRDVAGILDGAGKGEIEVVYLLGADEIDMNRLGKAFVIYQGHHGDAGAHRADVILPGAAYTEKSGTYVNTEGRVQRGNRAVRPPGDAREDWRILRALSERLGKKLSYDTIEALRARLIAAVPHFAGIGAVRAAAWGPFGSDGALDTAPFVLPIGNYYMTDPISRASLTMAKCTETHALGDRARTGTHG